MSCVLATSNWIAVSLKANTYILKRSGRNRYIDPLPVEVLNIVEPSNALPIVRTSREDETSNKTGCTEDVEIYCSACSRDGSLLTVATSAKTCLIYAPNDDFRLVRAFRIAKAPTSIAFDVVAQNVVIGDRAGNVTKYAVNEPLNPSDSLDINGEKTNHEGVPMSGAITMILDVAFSDDGKRLISADRDEKIRVSRYSHPFVIEAFCFGHESYVRSLAMDSGTVFSAGGDGTVRQFCLSSGRQIACSGRLHEAHPIRKLRVQRVEGEVTLFVLVEGQSEIICLSVTGETFLETKRLPLAHTPYDFCLQDNAIFVLTSGGLYTTNLHENGAPVLVTVDNEKMLSDLKNVKDPIPSYFKNVTHQNMVEYQERKAKKMEQVAEKKAAAKRKHPQNNVALDSKKMEVDTTA